MCINMYKNLYTFIHLKIIFKIKNEYDDQWSFWSDDQIHNFAKNLKKIFNLLLKFFKLLFYYSKVSKCVYSPNK